MDAKTIGWKFGENEGIYHLKISPHGLLINYKRGSDKNHLKTWEATLNKVIKVNKIKSRTKWYRGPADTMHWKEHDVLYAVLLPEICI